MPLGHQSSGVNSRPHLSLKKYPLRDYGSQRMTKPSRISDIECLRAFSVLAVVLHHAHGNLLQVVNPALNTFFSTFAGAFGVDLFFVISGFVIAKNLIPQIRQTSTP